MRAAAPATSRANRALGKTVAKNGPALPATRALRAPRAFPRRTAAPAAQCNRMSRCYIHVSRITNHPKTNRQPGRLESIVTHTKQTPATQINRQEIATSQITHRVISNRHTAPALTRHFSPVTDHCLSNRHTPRLENAKNPIKTHLSALLIVTKARFPRPSPRHENNGRGSRPTSSVVSNRQWQILECNVNHTKQTTAGRSNRHFFASLKHQISSLQRKKRSAPNTKPYVRKAMTISPSAPAKKARKPCLPGLRMLNAGAPAVGLNVSLDSEG
jgi:hypothetical protein